MITQVQANNSAAQRNDEETGNKITLYSDQNATTVLNTSDIRTGKMYIVEYPSNEDYSDTEDGARFWSNGYIKSIVIRENTGTSSGN